MFTHSHSNHFVLDHVKQFLANLHHRQLHILFEFLLGTSQQDSLVEFLFNILVDICVTDINTVNDCLMKKEFLYGYLFWNDTIRIAFQLRAIFQTTLLNVGTQNGFIANHPHHFIDDILLCHRKQAEDCRKETERISFLINVHAYQ